MTVWNPTDYHRNSAAQQAWARELIGKLRLRGDERMLDIGCGDGKVTAEIAARVPGGGVVGIDLSREMIDFAAATFGRDEHPNLSFAQLDASALAFDGEFDVVFSNAVLHWIADHEPVLRGIRRALRPGGRALLQMGGKGNAAGVADILGSMISQERWRASFTGFDFRYGFYGADEYRRWLIDAGLTPLRVELFPKPAVHADRQSFAGWFRTTWHPWISRVPEGRRQAFIDEVADRFTAAHPPDADGRVTVGMVRLEVEALRARTDNDGSYAGSSRARRSA